jgi:glycosyltransferase involved in cell wall biosynthesis
MKVLFLFPYPSGEAPSQRFRFEQYFHLLNASAIQYQTQSFWDIDTWRILYKPGRKSSKGFGFAKGILRRLRILLTIQRFDYVFIHRECVPLGPPFLEWLISVVFRKKIIYDFDDAIWLPNTSDENKLAAIIKWHGKVHAICKWSYKISCGNLYLCDYAYKYNRNVVLNPTTIDTDKVHNPVIFPRRESRVITIGWTGSHSTLKYLKELEGVLQELEEQYPDVVFEVIADRPPQLNLKRFEFRQWTVASEIADLARFDIGIMPLTDDIWAKGKCGFKALQYMAMEIATIASPVGVNSTIINHGVDGLLASSPAEWKNCLEKLIRNPDFRKQLGRNGREKVIRDYSVRSNSDNFLSLFT